MLIRGEVTGYWFLVSDDRNGWLRAGDGCWASASWDPNSTVIGPCWVWLRCLE